MEGGEAFEYRENEHREERAAKAAAAEERAAKAKAAAKAAEKAAPKPAAAAKAAPMKRKRVPCEHGRQSSLCKPRRRRPLSIFTSTCSCAPRVFRRASQGPQGRVVPFGGARQGPDSRLRTAVSSADRAESLGL